MPSTRSKLRLHRETLRTLARRDLAQAAGGTFVVYQLTLEIHGGLSQPAPRSNAWTGEGENATCNQG